MLYLKIVRLLDDGMIENDDKQVPSRKQIWKTIKWRATGLSPTKIARGGFKSPCPLSTHP